MHASRLQKELSAWATRDVSSRRVRACELVAMPLAEVDTPSLHSQEQRREASKVTLLRRLQRLVCSALAAGAVPRHVAFIMDGNRRYATAARVDRAQGHAHGFEKVRLVGLHIPVPAGCLQACLLHVTATTAASSLTRTPAALSQLLDALEWCFDLGVSVVTVYAFSIENFKVRGNKAVAGSRGWTLTPQDCPATTSAPPTKWPRSWPSRGTSWASWSGGCWSRWTARPAGCGLGSESWATCSCFLQRSALPPPG